MTNPVFNILLFISLFSIAGCGTDGTDASIYRIDGVMTVDGRTRTYLLNLPPHYYEQTENVPLVIGLHGTGGKATQFERDYKFTEKANSAGFMVVYPEGVRSNGVLGVRTWNAGTCCDYAKDNNVDDVEFIRELIDYIIANFNIDPKRVYVTGMSNGGMMAYRLACELPDKIAAIAAVSSTMVVAKPCDPSRAVPILHIHSIRDTKVPYNGGVGLRGYYFPPVDSVLDVWSSKDSCEMTGQVVVNNSDYRFTKWSACANDVTIEAYLTQDGGHAWPGGLQSGNWGDVPSIAVNANDLIWGFFQRFQLP